MANGQLRAHCVQVTYNTLTRACRKYGIAPSRFGRRAIGDPRLLFDMQNGRCLRPATQARVHQFIAGLEAQS